jgi:uncharacterized phage protein (TIGR01671 family)
MNREIKFRVWNKVDKCWQSEEHFAIRLCGDKWFIDDETAELIEIKNENNFTLMQYTGLTDKNGKEIYEGDILENLTISKELEEYVNVDNKYCQIIFSEGAFRLYFKGDLLCNEPYEIEDIGFYDLNNYQIIGNIFENPELLT